MSNPSVINKIAALLRILTLSFIVDFTDTEKFETPLSFCTISISKGISAATGPLAGFVTNSSRSFPASQHISDYTGFTQHGEN